MCIDVVPLLVQGNHLQGPIPDRAHGFFLSEKGVLVFVGLASTVQFLKVLIFVCGAVFGWYLV